MIIKTSIDGDDGLLFVNGQPVAYLRGTMLFMQKEENGHMEVRFEMVNSDSETMEHVINNGELWVRNKENVVKILEKNGLSTTFHATGCGVWIGDDSVDVIFLCNMVEFSSTQ